MCEKKTKIYQTKMKKEGIKLSWKVHGALNITKNSTPAFGVRNTDPSDL